jgi:hypothetical protein
VYDDSEHMIRIFALDGLQLVHCAVSKAALVALEDDALAGPHAMAVTYRRNQALVQEIAKRKYPARRFEVGSGLEIAFGVHGESFTNTQLAQVRWVKAAESKSWLSWRTPLNLTSSKS